MKNNVKSNTKNNNDMKNKKNVGEYKPTKEYKNLGEYGPKAGQQLTYKEHVDSKQKRLQEALEGIVVPEAMVVMDKPDHYRNRVHRLFHHDRSGTPISGYFSPEEGRVVPIEDCYIDDRKCQEIIHTIQGMLKSFKIKTHDTRTGHGLLRYVAVRRGLESKEIMVVLVLSSVIMPSKNNFVKALRKAHPDISTILISENYKDMDKIYGDKEVNLYGKGFISDTMCGKSFRINAKSSFTTNPIQMAEMCNKLLEWGAFTGEEFVLDAYCGAGTFGTIMANHVRKVYGVETSHDAYRDAISNIRKNEIKNMDMYKNSPAELLMQVAEAGKIIDDVIVTQPYNGCGVEFIQALVNAKPMKILFVSRNMKHLRLEIEQLVKKGYKVKKAAGIDVQPWTERIDACVLLER